MFQDTPFLGCKLFENVYLMYSHIGKLGTSTISSRCAFIMVILEDADLKLTVFLWCLWNEKIPKHDTFLWLS